MSESGVCAAVRYWASYPDEITAADAAEDAAEQAWRREHQLLASGTDRCQHELAHPSHDGRAARTAQRSSVFRQ
jgi:hypothetical protein